MKAYNLIILFFVAVLGVVTQAVEIDRKNAFRVESYHPRSPSNGPPVLGPRIVGGQAAERKQFPYQIALFVKYFIFTGFCAATLISKRYVLTAAHCAIGAKRFELILGVYDINYPELESITLNATKYIIHPKFDAFEKRNDIAIIDLEQEVPLSDYIQPIRLPSRTDAKNKFAGENGTVCGWGQRSDAGTLSPLLQYMNSEILTNKECSDSMIGLEIPSTQICTSGKGIKAACYGDSGGPLIAHDSNGKEIQVGIVSYGLVFGCERGYATAFTRVTKYLDFIEQHTDVIIAD